MCEDDFLLVQVPAQVFHEIPGGRNTKHRFDSDLMALSFS